MKSKNKRSAHFTVPGVGCALVMILSTVAGTGAAAPAIQSGSVVLSQEANRKVRIDYVLQNEAAVVTVDILTNGVSVGGGAMQTLSGDVNRRVEPGSRVLYWQPHKELPNAVLAAGTTKAVITAWSTMAPPPLMAIHTIATKTVRYYPDESYLPYPVTNDEYRTNWMLFRKVPAAGVKFRMGSPTTEADRNAARETPHLVELTYDYYLAVFETTIGQWRNIGKNGDTCYFGSASDSALRPAETISYEAIRGATASANWPSLGHAVPDASFIGKFRALAQEDLKIDLPTEAQWEYACRAGKETPFWWGTGFWNGAADPYAWHCDDSWDSGTKNVGARKTWPVGTKKPNAWGFYDMLGSVVEWCLDLYADDVTACDPEKGPTEGSNRVGRGGAFDNGSAEVRSAWRKGDAVTATSWNRGFRLAVHLH